MKRDYRNPKATANYRLLTENLGRFPFSFVYDGKEYKGFGGMTPIVKTAKTENEKESTSFVFSLGALEITLLPHIHLKIVKNTSPQCVKGNEDQG